MTRAPVRQPPRPATIPPGRVSSRYVESADAPLGDVAQELWHHMESLLRQELARAGAELDSKIQRLEREAAAFGAGMILVGLFALVAAIVLLLSRVMPAWVAALMTSAATTTIGFGLVRRR